MKSFPRVLSPEFRVFKSLNTPSKIQDYLDTFRFNFEPRFDTCRSPLSALKKGELQCMEGAMLASAILWSHGERPLLLDLKSAPNDDDHVIALFKRFGKWGAISKTNHAVLRYRDPVYASVRELAMSYFNEYFLKNGVKTMRSFSAPFDMTRYGHSWLTAESDLFNIMKDLDGSKHFDILPKQGTRVLRKADQIETKAGEFVEWNGNKKSRNL